MSRYILVTRPNSDRTTRYISEWAKQVIEFAEHKNCIALDLEGDRANRKEFESILRKLHPVFVFLNGHGSREAVAGQNEQILLHTNENVELLKGSITYALSCSSADVLGRKAVECGAAAYIGYQKEFIFLFDEKKRTTPLQDHLAKHFFEPSNQVAISLLKGHTAQKAHQDSRQAFGRGIRKLLTSQTTAQESATIRYLLWNRDHQVCLGKADAVI